VILEEEKEIADLELKARRTDAGGLVRKWRQLLVLESSSRVLLCAAELL